MPPYENIEESEACNHFWVVYETEAVVGGNPAGERRETISVVCPNCQEIRKV